MKINNLKTHYKTNKTFRAIFLVILCTIFTSTGQILWKIASKNLNSIHSIITNIPLIIGFICYALGAILLIISLKYGKLSILYPFVALSFIWVNIASIFIFKEVVSIYNWIGIFIIILGVSLIGYGSSK